jgi:hypothetical protein
MVRAAKLQRSANSGGRVAVEFGVKATDRFDLGG